MFSVFLKKFILNFIVVVQIVCNMHEWWNLSLMMIYILQLLLCFTDSLRLRIPQNFGNFEPRCCNEIIFIKRESLACKAQGKARTFAYFIKDSLQCMTRKETHSYRENQLKYSIFKRATRHDWYLPVRKQHRARIARPFCLKIRRLLFWLFDIGQNYNQNSIYILDSFSSWIVNFKIFCKLIKGWMLAKICSLFLPPTKF